MLKILRLDFIPLIDANAESHSVPPDDFIVAGY